MTEREALRAIEEVFDTEVLSSEDVSKIEKLMDHLDDYVAARVDETITVRLSAQGDIPKYR